MCVCAKKQTRGDELSMQKKLGEFEKGSKCKILMITLEKKERKKREREERHN